MNINESNPVILTDEDYKAEQNFCACADGCSPDRLQKIGGSKVENARGFEALSHNGRY